MKKIIGIIAGVFIGFSADAQDVHFTMFHVAPTVLNPASAGVFNGTFRGAANYKTQWGSVSNPYKTFSFTADGSVFKNRGGTAHMGMGISMYKDVAGSTNFGTTKINFSLSSILYLDEYSTFSIGLTGGWAQRTISPGDLQWDSQFDGLVFDPSLPSNESYTFQNSNNFDFAAGGLWSYGTSATSIASFDKFRAQIGAAYHHALKPSFFTHYGVSDRLYSKFVFHADMHYSAGYSKLALRPRINAFIQGPARELNLGMMFRYLISEGSKYTGNIKGLAISGGGYYRVGDAFSPSVELEFGSFAVGYTYDFNISSLRVASGGLGGSEFYIKFQNPNPFFKFSRRPSIR